MRFSIEPCRPAAALVGMAVAGTIALTAQHMPSPPERRSDTMRPEILGTHGIVAAGRHYSVAAGIRILTDGGNAIDAGVASVFAAAVCEISHFGFGGESPAMIYDAKAHEIIVVNGQGSAPKAATPDLFKGEGPIPGNGPLAATMPAVMDAMALALESKGTMRLEQVMQSAIELADGFPMYGFLRAILISERRATEQYEWSAKSSVSRTSHGRSAPSSPPRRRCSPPRTTGRQPFVPDVTNSTKATSHVG